MDYLKGADLALGAAEMADKELEEVKTLLRVRVIPHVIDSVWACGQSSSSAKKSKKNLDTAAVVELARLAVTFPGSVALTAMHQVLDQQGVDLDRATEYLSEFARLSREPLSALNHYRHVRTSINIYLKALVLCWDEEKMANESRTTTLNEIRSRVSPFIVLNAEKKETLSNKSEELGKQKLGTNTEIDNWLDEMTSLVSEGLAEDRMARTNRSSYESQLSKIAKNPPAGVSHTLTLYSGRFTHYIYKDAMKSLKIKPSDRYKPAIELQNTRRIEMLDSLVSKNQSDTFEYLSTIAARRPERSVNASSNFSRPKQKEFTQRFDLAGRGLEIEVKGAGMSPELIEKLMDNLRIQFELKIYGDQLLSGEVQDSRGAIRISLEDPKKSDLAQIQKIMKAIG